MTQTIETITIQGEAITAWLETTAATGTEGGITIKPARFCEPDGDRAEEQTKADAAESDRKSGEGSVRPV